MLPEKGVAFVQYKSILNAEFAKAAMEDQKLESDDVIFLNCLFHTQIYRFLMFDGPLKILILEVLFESINLANLKLN